MQLDESDLEYFKQTIPSNIGAHIKSIRKSQNVTQVQLAERTLKDRQYIMKIESGKVSPTVVTLLVLLKALDCPPERFFSSF